MRKKQAYVTSRDDSSVRLKSSAVMAIATTLHSKASSCERGIKSWWLHA